MIRYKNLLFAALISFAGFVFSSVHEDALMDILRTETGDLKMAYKDLTNYCATVKLSAGDAAKFSVEKVRMLLKMDDLSGATSEINQKLISGEGASAEQILTVMGFYLDARHYSKISAQRMILRALEMPIFKKKGLDRAKLLKLLARVYRGRSFCDLALPVMEEAIAAVPGAENAEFRNELLFYSADIARRMNKMDVVRGYLKRIYSDEATPYNQGKLARLEEGRSYIYKNQYQWKPKLEDVRTADKIISEVLSSRPSGIKAEDAFSAKRDIMHAYRFAGDLKKAVEVGIDLIENVPPKVKGLPVGPTCQELGDVLAEAKQGKKAVYYYEKAEPKGKVLHLKIAVAARSAGDYLRAIQGYTDALPFCDWEEGKVEIANIKNKAAALSRAVSGKAKAKSQDDIFNEESDAISELELDEF